MKKCLLGYCKRGMRKTFATVMRHAKDMFFLTSFTNSIAFSNFSTGLLYWSHIVAFKPMKIPKRRSLYDIFISFHSALQARSSAFVSFQAGTITVFCLFIL